MPFLDVFEQSRKYPETVLLPNLTVLQPGWYASVQCDGRVLRTKVERIDGDQITAYVDERFAEYAKGDMILFERRHVLAIRRPKRDTEMARLWKEAAARGVQGFNRMKKAELVANLYPQPSNL